MRINQRNKIESLLQAENAMTQRELAEAIYGDSSHSPNIYSVLMSLVNKKIVMRLDEHPARYSLYKMSTIQQATKQDCVEQSSSNVNGPPSITMSSEYAVDLIRAYFEQTAIDPHSRYFFCELCYKSFLMHRNEKSEKKEPILFYEKFPKDLSSKKIILMDPMLATGGSCLATIDIFIEKGVKQEDILFVNIISAVEGIETIFKKYPNIKMITAQVDPILLPNKYIAPGLGDFGDRFFGTVE